MHCGWLQHNKKINDSTASRSNSTYFNNKHHLISPGEARRSRRLEPPFSTNKLAPKNLPMTRAKNTRFEAVNSFRSKSDKDNQSNCERQSKCN